MAREVCPVTEHNKPQELERFMSSTSRLRNYAYTILINGCNLVQGQNLSDYGYFLANVWLGVINEGLDDGAHVVVSADQRHCVKFGQLSYTVTCSGEGPRALQDAPGLSCFKPGMKNSTTPSSSFTHGSWSPIKFVIYHPNWI